MGDYIAGKSDRSGNSVTTIEAIASVDVNAIADAVAKALFLKSKAIGDPNRNSSGDYFDAPEKKKEFDDSSTMKRMADAMIVESGKNESNFKDLGNVKENKAEPDVDKTVDLLKDLDD